MRRLEPGHNHEEFRVGGDDCQICNPPGSLRIGGCPESREMTDEEAERFMKLFFLPSRCLGKRDVMTEITKCAACGSTNLQQKWDRAKSAMGPIIGGPPLPVFPAGTFCKDCGTENVRNLKGAKAYTPES